MHNGLCGGRVTRLVPYIPLETLTLCDIRLWFPPVSLWWAQPLVYSLLGPSAGAMSNHSWRGAHSKSKQWNETAGWLTERPHRHFYDGSRTAHGTDAFNATKTKVQHKKDYWRYRDASDGTAGWQTDGSECDFKDGSWKAPEIDW